MLSTRPQLQSKGLRGRFFFLSVVEVGKAWITSTHTTSLQNVL